MPKVKHVKARKDYPQHGVEKGQMCYVWSLKTGPRSSRSFRQLTRPKPSQLTNSEFLGRAYELTEQVEDLTEEDLEDQLQELVDEIECLGEEQDEKWNNMPEGLQQGSTGELLEGRRDMCQEWAYNLEAVKDNLPEHPDESEDKYEEPTEPDEKDSESENAHEAAMEAYAEKLEAYENHIDNWEVYKSDLLSSLEEAQGYVYEGE